MMPAAALPASALPDPRTIEEAGLNAVQTSRQLFYDGWLLRLSPGTAKRGRCVSATFGSTRPLAEKIAHCESVYRRHALPPLFRVTPFDRPAALDAELAARGYVAFDDTLVQAAALAEPSPVPTAPSGVALDAVDVDAFVAAVGALRASSDAQVAAQRERLAGLPLVSRRLRVRSGERTVGVAQGVLDGDLVGIFDVVIEETARGRGLASLACAALLGWAREQGARAAYLQVTAANAPALAVYRKLGFATVYRYHYRGRAGECA